MVCVRRNVGSYLRGFLLIVIARIAALWQRDIVDKPSLPSWFLPFLTIAVATIAIGLIWIFASPIVRPFMLDPVYAGFARRVSVATAMCVATLIFLGTISVRVARHKAVIARTNEKKLSSVLEHMSEGVMLIDAKGTVSYQNPASLRIHDFELSSEGISKIQDLQISWQCWDEQDDRSASMSGRFTESLVARVFTTRNSGYAGARRTLNSLPTTTAIRFTTTMARSLSASSPSRTPPNAGGRSSRFGRANSAFTRWPTRFHNSHGWRALTDSCIGTTNAGTITPA